MILLFLKSYWKQLVAGVALALLLYTGYHKIYSIGYDKATVEYNEKLKDYETKLDKRISNIETNSYMLVQAADKDKLELKADFSKILTAVKNKPLYTLIEGKCTPSEDFMKAYNDAIARANKR